MEALTFTQSVALACALSLVALGIGLVFLGLLFGDGRLFLEGIWPKRKDTRPDVGVDIFRDEEPVERGFDDDATIEQLTGWEIVHEGRAMREARLRAEAEPEDDDPYGDITYATTAIAPSPLARLRSVTDETLQFQTAPGIEVHDHGRRKGDTTLMFEGIAEHEGHPVLVHGPDEKRDFAPVIGQRAVRWAR